jgi:hypothetical protein
MHTPSHSKRFPLSRHPNLPTHTSTKREPIPLFKLRIQKILQLDTQIPNQRVLHKVPIVDYFDGDDFGGFIGY